MKTEFEESNRAVDEPSASDNDQTGHWRVIIGRAIMIYLGLFLGVGVMMSLLGVNPLANNGAMPMGLLIFVGLAVLIALSGDMGELAHGFGRGWLSIVGIFNRKER